MMILKMMSMDKTHKSSIWMTNPQTSIQLQARLNLKPINFVDFDFGI